MIPNALLIQTPSIDFDTFLGLSQQALGYSPSEEVDASPLEHSETERFVRCLASLRKQEVTPNLMAHVSFSILVAADDRDMVDILSFGMPYVLTNTVVRGTQLAVITGTLAQWRDAVVCGSMQAWEFNVRAFFNRVKQTFESAGIDAWKDYETHTRSDKTLYLTHKR